jgi:hypothetical protein
LKGRSSTADPPDACTPTFIATVLLPPLRTVVLPPPELLLIGLNTWA